MRALPSATSKSKPGGRQRQGWAAGAGLEYAFLGSWSAKICCLYADLGSVDCGGTPGGLFVR